MSGKFSFSGMNLFKNNHFKYKETDIFCIDGMICSKD